MKLKYLLTCALTLSVAFTVHAMDKQSTKQLLDTNDNNHCLFSQEDWLNDKKENDPIQLVVSIQSLLEFFTIDQVSNELRKALQLNNLSLNDIVYREHWTALHIAAQCGNRDVANVLLASSDNKYNLLSHKGRFGYTAFHVAAVCLQKNVARVLLLFAGYDYAQKLLAQEALNGNKALDLVQYWLMVTEEKKPELIEKAKNMVDFLEAMTKAFQNDDKEAFNTLVTPNKPENNLKASFDAYDDTFTTSNLENT
jgi:hypothetical protein